MKKNFFIIGFLFGISFCLFAQDDNTQNRSATRPRTVLIEGFSSATCGYCPANNTALKNLLEQNQGKYASIKYQMDWPGNGDPYYTAEAGSRGGVYGINGIPAGRLDGTGTNIISVTAVNQRQLTPADMDIDVEFSVIGQTVKATVTITPESDITATNLRLYIAIVERETHNNWQTNPFQSTAERIFYQVMKKFIPNASGITLSNLTANEPVVFEQEWEFKGDYRKPNNAKTPINHDIEHSVENFDNLSIIAWVQNTSTKAVLQACDAGPYNVKYSTATQNGTIKAFINEEEIDSDILVEPNTEVTFTAEPDEWFEVKEWKYNGNIVTGVTGSEFSKVIMRNYNNVTVTFQASHYTVNYNTVNDFGTITATIEDDEIGPGDLVKRGSKIIFTATPLEGYEVRNWKNNGTTVSGNTSNQYTINSLNNNASVTVEFQSTHLIVNYDVINNYGTLSAAVGDEVFESGVSIKRGSQVIFTATPDEGSEIKEWRNNGILIPNNTTPQYVISSLAINVNVTVTFTNPSGINNSVLSGTNIYPNPFNNNISISNAENVKSVVIKNILGQTVTEIKSTGKSIINIDTKNLKEGIYLVNIQAINGEKIVYKIVKEK